MMRATRISASAAAVTRLLPHPVAALAFAPGRKLLWGRMEGGRAVLLYRRFTLLWRRAIPGNVAPRTAALEIKFGATRPDSSPSPARN